MKRIKKRFLWNFPQKIKLYKIIKQVSPYTKLSFDSLSQVYDCIKSIDKEEIEGDLVEMGCWSGGCGAFMSWCSKESNRKIWLFDSFEGLPELSEEDREWATKAKLKIKEKNDKNMKATGRYKTSEENVREILKKLMIEILK